MKSGWKFAVIWLSMLSAVVIVHFIREKSRRIESVTWEETQIEKLAALRDSMDKYDNLRKEGYVLTTQRESLYELFTIRYDSVAAVIREHGPRAAQARDSIGTRIQRSIQQRLPRSP